MKRSEALAAIGELKVKHDAISVATMTAVPGWTFDLFLNYRLHVDVTCMGQAAPIGLGLALGRPDKQVIVIDGDGSLLHQMGILAVIGSKAPHNFHHFILCNGVYQSTGGQPIPQSFNWAEVVDGIYHKYPLAEVPKYLGFDGPNLYPISIDEEPPLPWPLIDFKAEVLELREALARS